MYTLLYIHHLPPPLPTGRCTNSQQARVPISNGGVCTRVPISNGPGYQISTGEFCIRVC